MAEQKSAEFVVVGCRLPHGIIIRVGERSHTIKGLNKALVIGGHGVTENVPKDLWDAWAKIHAKSKMITSGAIFAHSEAASVEAMAKEAEKERTGFEGLDPVKPGAGIEPMTDKV